LAAFGPLALVVELFREAGVGVEVRASAGEAQCPAGAAVVDYFWASAVTSRGALRVCFFICVR